MTSTQGLNPHDQLQRFNFLKAYQDCRPADRRTRNLPLSLTENDRKIQSKSFSEQNLTIRSKILPNQLLIWITCTQSSSPKHTQTQKPPSRPPFCFQFESQFPRSLSRSQVLDQLPGDGSESEQVFLLSFSLF